MSLFVNGIKNSRGDRSESYPRICPCGYPQVEVFHAVAATAENGEDGPYYLAVLIANKLTAKPQVGVDYRGQNRVKSVQNEKYSAKSADFLRLLLYLCHVIDDFACLDLQH